ncbi:MAG TPA: hypothetical protein VFS60_14915 [Thermoanaerobaculia bacterium]|nr:hypothetical protein [Thermoanaerobaculia bacterium]
MHSVLTGNPPPPRLVAPPLEIGAYELPGIFRDGFERGKWSSPFPP